MLASLRMAIESLWDSDTLRDSGRYNDTVDTKPNSREYDTCSNQLPSPTFKNAVGRNFVSLKIHIQLNAEHLLIPAAGVQRAEMFRCFFPP